MRNLYKLAILTCTSLAIWSCSKDDFLDVESRERIEAGDRDENFTPSDFVTGVYGMFTEWPYAFSYLGITEIISDNADKGANPGGTGTDKHFLDDLEFSSTVPSVQAMWEHWYKTIGRANYAIAVTQADERIDSQLQERLVGESKFLRAYTYFFLVRSFGGIPIQGEIEMVDGEAVVDPGADLSIRNSRQEVYDYIEQDLLEAIEALPEKSEYDAADLGLSLIHI